MANDVKDAAKVATAAEEQKKEKKVRRGVASARGTTRLKFSHENAMQNGLFIGHIDSVVVSIIKIGEDTTGMPSFNGYEIPRITITFASNEEEAAKRHYIPLTFNAVESNVKTIPGGDEEWKVNTIFDWFKHILNVFVLKGREMTEEEETALSLNFEDFDENGEYVAVEPENVINGWKVLFENFAAIMNTGRDGSPVYIDKNGKFISLWIKLIRFVRNKKKGWQPVNNGDLAFPSFVGEGCIEIYKQNTIPSIKLDAMKETILPMKIEKPKTPNTPNMPNMGIGMGAGIPVGGGMTGNTVSTEFNNIAAEAQEDMPF